jgi:hypothetical protein
MEDTMEQATRRLERLRRNLTVTILILVIVVVILLIIDFGSS